MKWTDGLTADALRNAVVYEPNSGEFRQKLGQGRRVRRGLLVAGYLRPDGYRVICVLGKHYLAHRLAWLYEHGTWPADQIDHVNGIRCDNSIANLRAAVSAENNQNRGRRCDNSSGFVGVSAHKSSGRWQAKIGVAGRRIHLGLFASAGDAAQAYIAAKARSHTFNPEVRA